MKRTFKGAGDPQDRARLASAMAVAGRGTWCVVVALCLGSVSGFCPGGAAPSSLRGPALLPRHALSRATADRARVVVQAQGGGQPNGSAKGSRLLDLLEFVIGTTFNSRLYVGRPELHVAVPLPQPDQYPAWMPSLLRLPQGVYGFVEKGVEEGWIKRAPADRVFEIKYGMQSRFRCLGGARVPPSVSGLCAGREDCVR